MDWIYFTCPLVKVSIEDIWKEKALNLEAVWTNLITFKSDQSDISDACQDSLLTAWGFSFGRGKTLSLRHRPVVSVSLYCLKQILGSKVTFLIACNLKMQPV